MSSGSSDSIAREGRLASVSGALLLGGASSRMGRDKARLMLNGEPLATHMARRLAALFEEVLLVGGEAPARAPRRRIPDPAGPRSPLRGLVGALGGASADRVLVVATDLPLVTTELLLALTAWPEAEAVVPRSAGRLQPLCAVYRRQRVLERARRRLGAGELTLQGLLMELECSVLDEKVIAALDPSGEALANANTPEDWERVRRLAEGAAARPKRS